MKKILLATVILTSFLLHACGEDEEPKTNNTNTGGTTNTDLLVNAEWLLTGGDIIPPVEIDFNGSTITINDYWQLVALLNQETEAPDCAKDNLMMFFRDSTLTLDEGPTRCESSDPQTEDGGSWWFTSNETKILFSSFPLDPTGEERLVDITTLTSDSLALRMDYRLYDPFSQDSTDHEFQLWMINQK